MFLAKVGIPESVVFFEGAVDIELLIDGVGLVPFDKLRISDCDSFIGRKVKPILVGTRLSFTNADDALLIDGCKLLTMLGESLPCAEGVELDIFDANNDVLLFWCDGKFDSNFDGIELLEGI